MSMKGIIEDNICIRNQWSQSSIWIEILYSGLNESYYKKGAEKGT